MQSIKSQLASLLKWTRKIDPKIYIELQGTLNSQNNRKGSTELEDLYFLISKFTTKLQPRQYGTSISINK